MGNGSLEECAERCSGYNYFGRQGSGECRCGNTYGRYDSTTGCNCDSETDIGVWKQCIYHLRTPCSSGVIIPNSNRTHSAPCQGVDGEECAFKCDAGYLAIGRHVCQTYSVSGKNVIDHAFFGGRCERLCASTPCETGRVPIRRNSTENGVPCLKTQCLEPKAALLQLTKGGYELFKRGRNPKTGTYMDHVDVKIPAEKQDHGYASLDATAVGMVVECVAANLGIISIKEAQENVLTTMHALTGRIPGFRVARNPRGFLPTFINSDTGVSADPSFSTDSTGMIGVSHLFVKTCFENSDPGSAATKEISALSKELHAAVQYDTLMCDHGSVTGQGRDIPFMFDNASGCSNVLSPGPDGYFYYDEMIWIAELAFQQACGKQPAGQCNNKPIERMWAAWQGRRNHLWYYWGGQGLLTTWPSFLLQLPFYLVHAFNSDPVYVELFSRQWQAEWNYYKSDAFHAGEDGRYGVGAGPTMEWCAGAKYTADMIANWTDGSQQHCRMYSPYAVAGYLPASPSVIQEHLLALLSSGEAVYPLVDSDLFVLWRKSLLDPSWAQPDWGITLVDFAAEFYGLSTLWLGAEFFKRNTDYWSDGEGGGVRAPYASAVDSEQFQYV